MLFRPVTFEKIQSYKLRLRECTDEEIEMRGLFLSFVLNGLTSLLSIVTRIRGSVVRDGDVVASYLVAVIMEQQERERELNDGKATAQRQATHGVLHRTQRHGTRERN